MYGYARFVGKTRENLNMGLGLKTAITKAVAYCIDEGILADFLKTHASEVLNMLTTEWNIERAKVVWKQESWEDGLEQGLEKGREEGIAKGVNISAEIIKDIKRELPIERIAARHHVPTDTIKQLQAALI